MNYKFSTIGKLGVMSRRKTYRDKKVYVQTLINTMQEVFDLAVEHGLTGELHYGQQLTKAEMAAPELRKTVAALQTNVPN